MVDKHLRRCSTSYVTSFKIQINITVQCHYTCISMAKVQNIDSIKFCQGSRVTKTVINCWWECKMVQSLRKIVWWFLWKLNIFYHMTQQLLCSLIFTQRRWNLMYPQKPAHKTFTAALFITANSLKQVRCPPSTSKMQEVNAKLWYTKTIEYYLAPKRNEPFKHMKEI